MNALKFKEITEKQLQLAHSLYTGNSLAKRIQANYERMVNITCTKHLVHDGVVYISDCGALGFRIIKFYDDIDYRIGSCHASAAEAYSYAMSYM